MRPSPSLCSKASKFQLISKHANKDYYKGPCPSFLAPSLHSFLPRSDPCLAPPLRSPAGRRQSQPTGVGYRTGPPGKHVGPEKSQFLIDDERVRVFVGPAFKADGSSEFAFDKVRVSLFPRARFRSARLEL